MTGLSNPDVKTAVAIAAIVAAADVALKLWVSSSLDDGVVAMTPLGIEFVLSFNSGMAFGLLSGQPALVLPLALIALGALGVILLRIDGRLAKLASSLILGGASANIGDRMADGTVTDYIVIGPWPSFNLADIAIVVGVGLLMVTLLRVPPGSRQDLTQQAER